MELQFLFATSPTRDVTIPVPFNLFNLTLEPPLVDQPTPYFPCLRNLRSTHWTLGRAFLRAAYLYEHPGRRYFLAQAPGPKFNQTPSLAKINTTQNGSLIAGLSRSTSEYTLSWEDSWSPLAAPNASSTPTTMPSSPGLSTGQVAAIVFGILGVFILTGNLSWLVVRRKHRSREARPQDDESIPSERLELGPTTHRGSAIPAGEMSAVQQQVELGGSGLTEVAGRTPSEISSRAPKLKSRTTS